MLIRGPRLMGVGMHPLRKTCDADLLTASSRHRHVSALSRLVRKTPAAGYLLQRFRLICR